MIPAAMTRISRISGLRILTLLLSMISLGKTCNQVNMRRRRGVHSMCRLYDRPLSKRPRVNLYVTTGLVSPNPDINDRKAIAMSMAALQRETFL